MNRQELLKFVYPKLLDHQKDLIKQCKGRGSGGLCSSLGSGKTLMAIYLTLEMMKDDECGIIIVSKTNISTWMTEIDKFFGKNLKYVVLHKEFMRSFDQFKLDKDVKLILTTSEVTSKVYTNLNVESDLIYYKIENQGRFGEHSVCCYNTPTKPYRSGNFGPSILYSIKWGMIAIDEIQDYTNVTTIKCRSLMSLFSDYRWGLSGTMFNEPKVEKILGYFLLVNDLNFPRNLPNAKSFLESDTFTGINERLVIFKEKVVDIKVNEFTITNDLNKYEERIYLSMKEILVELKKIVNKSKRDGDTIRTRKFNAYILAMLTYLRQCIVNPLIQIANIYLDISNLTKKKELSRTIMDHLNRLDLKEYLNDERNIISSRMQKVIEIVKKSPKKVLIFTCFRTNLDILEYYFSTEMKRKVLTVEGTMKTEKRDEIIKTFNDSDDIILLLTYKIGCKGLNLQTCSNILLCDFEWSDDKTMQAIGRVVRQGQKSKEVNVYYFLSNLAVEKAVFKKQKQKMELLTELESGSMKTKVEKITTAELINIITAEENESIFSDVRKIRTSRKTRK